jgi:PAT family beta-lactamase induction signal transducer AmpG
VTVAPDAARVRPRIRPTLSDALAVYLKLRVLIVLLLGFSAGLPLALSGSTLLVWMREAGVDLGTIGLFALVGTPYTIKFLWAPVVDATDVPILSSLLGRRRGWLVLSQLLLIAAIVLLAFCNPATSPWLVALGALLVSTCSATQDVVIDAFRIESLPESEQAAGMASYVAAYRIGMLVSTAGALFLVSGFEGLGLTKSTAWTAGYLAMAALVLIGVITALMATEPERSLVSGSERDHETSALESSRLATALKYTFLLRPALTRLLRTRIGTSAYQAFAEFLTRDMALVVLGFVVLYKFCDAFAGALTAPFVIDLGFSRNDYAAIVKGVGLGATLIGGFAGGALARAYPLVTALWLGAFLQMASNLVFTWQALVGVNLWALTLTIVVENFTGAIGTVIFVAYLSALCQSPLHTATQYALLTALSAVGRTYLSAAAGFVAEKTGWPMFFVISAATALPSIALLAWLQRRGHFATLQKPTLFSADD